MRLLTVALAGAALTTVVVTIGCSGSGGMNPVAPSPPAATPAVPQHASTHFTFQYQSIDAASVANTAALVEAQYDRIVADLASPPMSRITVHLHPDFPSLQAAVQSVSGTLPSFAVGLVTNAVTIHLISPNVAATWTYEDGVKALIHEFAHCVSMHLNPSIPNSPRWLWEAVAVFEANDFVDPRTQPGLVSGQPPTLARLNGFENVDIYLVGFTIGEFIVSRWGREGLVTLIRNNGDTAAVTGFSPTAFLAEWYAFVRQRYLTPP